MSPSSRTPGALRRSGPLLGFLVALMLLAANMRTGIVVLGPLADGIGEDLNLDAASLGLLTTLPLLCFAVLSLFAPRLGDRLGLERALLMGLPRDAPGAFPPFSLATRAPGARSRRHVPRSPQKRQTQTRTI